MAQKSTIIQELEALKIELSDLKDLYELKINEAENVINNLSDQKDEIRDFYSEYFVRPTTTEKAKIDKFRIFVTEVEDSKTEVETNSEFIENSKTKIDKFNNKIFGIEGKEKDSLSFELDEISKKFTTLLTKSQKEHSTLLEKIEGLLPGATATGLAKAYQEQKDSYKTPINLWSGIFFVTMLVMTGFSIYFVKDTKDLTGAFINILSRIPFYVPTIWLALFASKQQSQYKRLEQEYANKEAFAKSYMGFREQIESLDSEPIMNKFMDYLVEITAYNPSSTLDNKSHEDSPPLISRILDLGSKKEEKGTKDTPK